MNSTKEHSAYLEYGGDNLVKVWITPTDQPETGLAVKPNRPPDCIEGDGKLIVDHKRGTLTLPDAPFND